MNSQQVCLTADRQKWWSKVFPTKTKSLHVVLITDSQCTAHCHSDRFCHKIRRRRNVGVRFSRSLRRLHSENDNVEILLMWMAGKDNPSDLASKIHENVSQILNSIFGRKGSELYLRPEFPAIPEGIIYAQLKDEKFTNYGLPSTAQHLTMCNYCSSNVETGRMIAN